MLITPNGAAGDGIGGDAPWHALGPAEVVEAVGSDAGAGLDAAEARRRLERLGPNALPEAEARSPLWVFLGQFRSPLIYLLLGASALALSLGHVSDAVVILVVVLLNAVVGALQEGRAERSLRALRQLSSHRARVVRGGVEDEIEAREVVVGDVLALEAGDAVPADARLLEHAALQVAEAALTGESVPVAKAEETLGPDAPLGDRRNMVHAGTHITAGRARAVVVAVGTGTEIGQIARLAEGAQEPDTPLERRIARFGRTVIVAAAVMFVVVNLIGFARGLDGGTIAMVAISQVVGMIPEGLPVAMTIALAVGVQRMSRRRAVVRRLAAVETLGSTTVICSDKTGTLTRNEMTVVEIALPGGRRVSVSGVGYEPRGEFTEGGAPLDPAADGGLGALLEAALLCNDATLQGPAEEEPRWRPIGDPTEVALVALAAKAGMAADEARARLPRRAEIPFDPDAKMMATQHEGPAGPVVFLKGAPEALIDRCGAARVDGRDVPLDGEGRRAFGAAADAMGERALRVLAVGVVPGGVIDAGGGLDALGGRLTMLGLVGQMDPPRDEAREAVARCRAAGIRPVMVTGDHKATGYAVARELGIAVDGDLALDGAELEQLGDDALARRIDQVSVFARVHPAQKLRIVECYQGRGEVVAMTGDGVNDAPALAAADVGVAMGNTGTEVAKEASKIVLGDDDFATIVAAVEEGRVVYRNIKKVVLYLVATSAAEVVVLTLALLMGYPPPLAAVQILWINLVTEGAVTVNLIMEPAEGEEMRARPIPRDEPLLTRTLLARMAVMTPTMAASTLGWFTHRVAAGVPFAQAQTEAFTVLAVCQWFNVLSCRSETRSVFGMSLSRNPWLLGGLVLGMLLQVAVVFVPALNRLFHTVPIALGEALAIGAVASLVLWAEEARKLIQRRRGRGPLRRLRLPPLRPPAGVLSSRRRRDAGSRRVDPPDPPAGRRPGGPPAMASFEAELDAASNIVQVVVTEDDGSEHDYQFDFDPRTGRWEFSERDLLERDFGDEWVEELEEEIERLIAEGVEQADLGDDEDE